MARYRIGVDIGGTFTDCLIVNDTHGAVGSLKIPSQPRVPESAVLDGIRHLLRQYSVDADSIGHFGHGTTLATNTIIEETGVPVGLLVTRGFRDILFLGRARFPDPTNLNGRLPRHLIARQDVREVTERVSADGQVITPLSTEEVIAAVRDLVRNRGVKAIVVSFLHSYRNPDHEEMARKVIEEAFTDLFVCCSSQVWARPREYERTLVGVMNAYVGDRMRRYLNGLSGGAAQLGIPAPVLVTKSNGGVMNADTAGEYPVQTMLSGPAAGVVGAMHFAQLAGFPRIITWDMGGTSLDVAIIDGRLRYSDSARIGDYPLFIPTVDVLSVGAGGGSVAWVDRSHMLHVGPRSAGADPGPACYGRGGERPTLTDAYLALGIINPDYFAGGTLPLRPELAERALARLGKDLGTTAIGAAEAMLRVATAQMYAQFMPLAARYGAEPAEYTLFPYGGAGPTHAFLFAREANVGKVLVPLFPGLLCAWGALIADLRFDVPAAIGAGLESLDESELNARLASMAQQATSWMRAQKVPILGSHLIRYAYVRYRGQSFEVETPLPGGQVKREEIRRAFLRAYKERYGYADPEAPLEVVEVLIQCIGTTHKPVGTPALLPTETRSYNGPGYRMVHVDGEKLKVPAVQRSNLGPGDTLMGPILVDQPDTTTFIPPGFRAKVDPSLNLIGERTEHG